MKKVRLVIAVLTLSVLAFVSCKKDDKPAVSGETMTFTGRIGGDAKTEINGFEMTWSDGDEVRINGKVFESELTSDRKTATFTGEYLMPPYEAYYPAGLYDETGKKYALPKTQHYAGVDGNDLSGINPMYAESDNADLTFHNICAMIRLDVTGEGTVKAVKVSSATPLSGEFEIKCDAANGFYAQLKPASSKDHDTLTLDCGENGVSLSATDTAVFYIALPKGNYTDLNFELSNGTVTWKLGDSELVSATLDAGKLYTKKLTDVKFVKPEKLKGKFTVNGGSKIQFSRGNLYCTRTAKTGGGYSYSFAFEDNQYDYRSYNDSYYGDCFIGGENKVTPENTSGMFQWNVADASENRGYGAFTNENRISGSTTDVMDWGSAMGSGWRTITGGSIGTGGEWEYLFDIRATTYGTGSLSTDNRRYAEVKVNGVRGILLFPDEFSWPLSPDKEPTTFNTFDSNWNGVDYGITDFAALEDAGCVFLPAAGYRDYESVYSVSSFGYYWSSMPNTKFVAYYLGFGGGYVYLTNVNTRYCGFAVRLVCAAE